MARKPIPLSRVAIANSSFVPPVTGVNGSNIPVTNLYDDSGVFRNRVGSRAKRARTESEIERDAAYDLSRDYPPLVNPEKPALDPTHIKTLLVSATALTSTVAPLLETADTPPSLKALITLTLTMLQVLEAVVEKGIEPLSSAAAAAAGGRNFLKAYQKRNAPPAVAAKPPPSWQKRTRRCFGKI